MTNTPYQDAVEKQFELFDKLNSKDEMAYQIEEYIKAWKDFHAEMSKMNFMAS